MASKEEKVKPGATRGKILLKAQEVTFVKALAGNSKELRDRALRRLKKWFKARSQGTFLFTEEDFMRLWKGLFYSMWMSDKPLIQEELAESISDLVHAFSQPKQSYLFVRCFFTTMALEWFGLDQLRLNKFLMLVRRFLRQSLVLTRNLDWDRKAVKQLNTALRWSLLTTESHVPLGLLGHFLDVYLEELAKIGREEIAPKTVTLLLQPFVRYFSKCTETNTHRLLRTHVLDQLIEQHDIAFEYRDRFEAWKKAGYPGSGPEDMERVEVSEEEEKAEVSGSEEEKAEVSGSEEEEKGEVSGSEDEEKAEVSGSEDEEKAEVSGSEDEEKPEVSGSEKEEGGDDAEPGETNERMIRGHAMMHGTRVSGLTTALDPRAGNVNVVLPQIPFDPADIADMMRRLSEKAVTKRCGRALYRLSTKFATLARGRYPFAKRYQIREARELAEMKRERLDRDETVWEAVEQLEEFDRRLDDDNRKVKIPKTREQRKFEEREARRLAKREAKRSRDDETFARFVEEFASKPKRAKVDAEEEEDETSTKKPKKAVEVELTKKKKKVKKAKAAEEEELTEKPKKVKKIEEDGELSTKKAKKTKAAGEEEWTEKKKMKKIEEDGQLSTKKAKKAKAAKEEEAKKTKPKTPVADIERKAKSRRSSVIIESNEEEVVWIGSPPKPLAWEVSPAPSKSTPARRASGGAWEITTLGAAADRGTATTPVAVGQWTVLPSPVLAEGVLACDSTTADTPQGTVADTPAGQTRSRKAFVPKTARLSKVSSHEEVEASPSHTDKQLSASKSPFTTPARQESGTPNNQSAKSASKSPFATPARQESGTPNNQSAKSASKSPFVSPTGEKSGVTNSQLVNSASNGPFATPAREDSGTPNIQSAKSASKSPFVSPTEEKSGVTNNQLVKSASKSPFATPAREDSGTPNIQSAKSTSKSPFVSPTGEKSGVTNNQLVKSASKSPFATPTREDSGTPNIQSAKSASKSPFVSSTGEKSGVTNNQLEKSASKSPFAIPTREESGTPNIQYAKSASKSPFVSPTGEKSSLTNSQLEKSISKTPIATPAREDSSTPNSQSIMKSASKSPFATPTREESGVTNNQSAKSASKSPFVSPTGEKSEVTNNQSSKSASKSPREESNVTPNNQSMKSASKSPFATPAREESGVTNNQSSKSASKSPREESNVTPNNQSTKSASKSPSATPAREKSEVTNNQSSKSASKSPREESNVTPNNQSTKSASKSPLATPARREGKPASTPKKLSATSPASSSDADSLNFVLEDSDSDGPTSEPVKVDTPDQVPARNLRSRFSKQQNALSTSDRAQIPAQPGTRAWRGDVRESEEEPSSQGTSEPPSSQGTSEPPSSQGTSEPPSSQGTSEKEPSGVERPSLRRKQRVETSEEKDSPRARPAGSEEGNKEGDGGNSDDSSDEDYRPDSPVEKKMKKKKDKTPEPEQREIVLRNSKRIRSTLDFPAGHTPRRPWRISSAVPDSPKRSARLATKAGSDSPAPAPAPLKARLRGKNKAGAQVATSPPPPREASPVKKVNIVLARNSSYNFRQYRRALETSPGIPYDAERVPSQGVLRNSSETSPINPFYSLRKIMSELPV